jgi:hypothetical protein
MNKPCSHKPARSPRLGPNLASTTPTPRTPHPDQCLQPDGPALPAAASIPASTPPTLQPYSSLTVTAPAPHIQPRAQALHRKHRYPNPSFPNDSSAQAPPPSPLSPSHPSTQEPSQVSTQVHPTRPSHHALALSPHAPTPPRPSLHAHQPKLPSSHAHPSPRMNGLKPHADTHVRAPTDSRPTLTQAPPRPNLNPSILSARQLSPSIQPAHACPSPCPLVYPPKYPLVHSPHPKAM